MRIDFDCQIFSTQPFGGISRYFASLTRELALLPAVEPRIVAPLHVNAYLRQLPNRLVTGLYIDRPPYTGQLIRAASVLASECVQFFQCPDIVHKTYYYPLPHKPRGAASVLTVFDMIHEKFPRDFSDRDPVRRWKKAAVKMADHVICISEQTRRDLLSTHDLPEEKVSVTYLGYDPLSKLLEDESDVTFRARVLGADVPYLLYVGSRAGYKNFAGLLDAYAASPLLREHFKLLCFGGGPLTDMEHAHIRAAGITDRINHIGGSDAVLASCYRHAALFVYPSLYEGFGIPPLEAMSLDCPVACSNTSSIPEVVGDAVEYFDPTDISSIRASIECVLQSASRRAELVKQGRLRCELFSWKRCAEATASIYQKVLQK